MESITYYTHDDEEFGVLALTLDQLRTVSAVLRWADDLPRIDVDMAHAINIEVERGVAHLTDRLGDSGGL